MKAGTGLAAWIAPLSFFVFAGCVDSTTGDGENNDLGRLFAPVQSKEYDRSMEEAGRVQMRQEFYEDGQLKRRWYVLTGDFGQLEVMSGSFETWYANGNKCEDGQYSGLERKDGMWQTWREDGSLQTSTGYCLGELHGKVIQYNDVGVIVSEETYYHGRLVK